MSHIDAWKRCIEINEPIIVIEEDLDLTQAKMNRMEKAMLELPSDAYIAAFFYVQQFTYHTGDKMEDNTHWNRMGPKMIGAMCYRVTPAAARYM